MPHGKLQVNMFDLVASIARVVDMMSPEVGNHHMQVAYLAYRLGEQLDLTNDKIYELFTAGALHDVGAFSLKDRLDLLEFENKNPGQHARAGSLMLSKFKPFSPVARIIKFHHVPWQDGSNAIQEGEPVLPGSHIIHLADRVAVQISKTKPILSQVQDICATISAKSGEVFVPEHVDALQKLTRQEYIWLEVTSGNIESILRKSVLFRAREMDITELVDFARLICQLIDFKSEFTATHSSGVAATAVALSKLAGFSSYERRLMEIAAYLHDLGKLAIPSEILEKSEKLTEDEWFVMRSHVYYTYQVLDPFEMFKVISSWSALHQERLNGKGYPFGYTADDLPLGARIMAVADVFTALTENRPYRKGMDKKETIEVLHSMVDQGELEKKLVDTTIKHFDEIDEVRKLAQIEASREYDSFQEKLYS
ncbi:HD-GYP domain-containing protein [Thermodesulfobacteriota bacterium]